MSVITNLIDPRIRKLILNHLTGNNCPEFCNGFLDTYFFKLTLGSDCLELFLETHFENHPDTYYNNTSPFQTRALNTLRCICRL